MNAVLSVVRGPAEGRRITVPSGELELGRGCPSPGDLGPDSSVSRRHALISVTQDGRVAIRDLGSANGTYVNGERLSKFDRHQLHHGDTIVLGETVMELETGGSHLADTASWDHDRSARDRAHVSFHGSAHADRGGIVAGTVEGGIHRSDHRTYVGDSISGATGTARVLIGVGIVVAFAGFCLFAYPIVMMLSEGFGESNGPGRQPPQPDVDFMPYLPLGFALATVGAGLIQFGVFLKR